MEEVTWIRNRLNDVGGFFLGLSLRADDIPLIGNWCGTSFADVSLQFYRVSIDLIAVNRWFEDTQSRILNFLTWDQIRTRLLGTWAWLNDIDNKIWAVAWARIRATWSWIDHIDDKIWAVAWARIRATWSWIDHIDDRIWAVAWSRIRATWSWIDNIDDKIWAVARTRILSTWSYMANIDDKIWAVAWSRIRATWSWIDHIDDRIKSVAWDYVSERLWDFFEFAAPKVARTAYRVLSYVWNLEWDDKKKEVKS